VDFNNAGLCRCFIVAVAVAGRAADNQRRIFFFFFCAGEVL
jgi:hypothetical protein